MLAICIGRLTSKIKQEYGYGKSYNKNANSLQISNISLIKYQLRKKQ